MENSFSRVKSIINRLREVLKCQKCFQMKEEDLMILYHACDHFYCTDCASDNKPCPLCSNPFDKPSKVIDDKNILSLYQSLKKFELPSKIEIDKIYRSHKESKDKKQDKEVEERDLVLETPKHKLKTPAGLRKGQDSLNSPNGSNFDTVILSSSEGDIKGVAIPTTSGKGKSATPRRERSVTTPAATTPVGRLNSTTGNIKSTGSASKTNVNKRNPKGETLLHVACKKGNIAAMSDLIAAGANPNAQDNAGWTPLHDSVFSGNLEVIKFLLDNRAKVNIPGLENTTALHEAVAKGNVQIVKLLLEYGADINAMNMFRETPLDLVTKYQLHDMKKVLLETSVNKKLTSEITTLDRINSKIVLFKYNLPIEDEKLVNKFAEEFNAEISPSLTSKTPPTHIIIHDGKVEMTWALISSIPSGCWVITVNWVKDSLKCKTVEPPNDYEPPSLVGFSKARKNKEQQLPGLFSRCHFYFGGNFEQYTVKQITVGRDDLKNFAMKNGGIVLKRCPDPESLALEKTVPFHAPANSSLKETSYFIIYQKDKWDPKLKYNMSHMKTLPVEWLVCCILRFELIDPNDKEMSYLNFLQ